MSSEDLYWIDVPYIGVLPDSAPHDAPMSARAVGDSPGGDPPVVSQIDNAPAPNDCGPACVMMAAKWVGKADGWTVSKLAAAIHRTGKSTGAPDLRTALIALGMSPAKAANITYPYIALVDYQLLPVRYYPKIQAWHWVLRLDEERYHDPLYPGTQGANKRMTAREWAAAEIGAVYRVGFTDRPIEKAATIVGQPAGTKVRVKSTSSNVRPQPTTQPTVEPKVLGTVVKGAEATVAEVVNGEGGAWYAWPLAVGGMPLFDATDDKTPRKHYIRADQFEPIIATPAPTPTPTPVPTPTRLADPRYILGIHELGGKGKAAEALSMDSRAVGCFNNAVGAAQLADRYRDSVVWHRIYHTAPISADELLIQHGINPAETSRSRAFYRGRNESDVQGYDSSPQGIKRRAEFDMEMATKLRRAAPDATYIAGGFAHGNPDFTNPDVCDAVRTYYAPGYNAGLFWFDIHNYDKSNPNDPKDFRFYAPKWFAARFQFLFTHCGFDPRIRHICSTEDGVETGRGGMRQAGFTSGEVRAWMAYRLKVVRQALVMPDGKQYDSPYMFGTGFQWGDEYAGSGGWWGYGLSPYISEFQAAYRGEIAAERAAYAPQIDLNLGAQPPANYHPPAKAFSL